MTTLIVEHGVENYTNWRKVYDAHAAVRDRHGIESSRVFRSADNDNHLLVIMEGTLENLDRFTNDPDLKAAMQEAGVTGKPNFTMLDHLSATV